MSRRKNIAEWEAPVKIDKLIGWALLWSYKKLHPHLQRCFLYCAGYFQKATSTKLTKDNTYSSHGLCSCNGAGTFGQTGNGLLEPGEHVVDFSQDLNELVPNVHRDPLFITYLPLSWPRSTSMPRGWIFGGNSEERDFHSLQKNVWFSSKVTYIAPVNKVV
jgi:hypothetical protein